MSIPNINVQSSFDATKDTWWFYLIDLLGIVVIVLVIKIVQRFLKKYKKNNSISFKCVVKVKNISNYYGSVYLWYWKKEKKTFFVDQKFILEEIERHKTLVDKQIKASDTEDSLVPENSTIAKFDNSDLTDILKKICVFNEKKNALFLQDTLYQFIKNKLDKGSVVINLDVIDDKFKNLEFNKLYGTDFESKNNITFLQ